MTCVIVTRYGSVILFLIYTINVLNYEHYFIFFGSEYCFVMQLFLKILNGTANNIDPDQTVPQRAV